MPYKTLEARRTYELINKEKTNARRREYYKNNREKILAISKKRYVEIYSLRPDLIARNSLNNSKRVGELRNKVISKLGGKCAHCGWTDSRALQIDHIFGGGNQDRIRQGKTRALHGSDYREMLSDANLHLKFQVLCANHNSIKKHENNEFGRRFIKRDS